MTFVKKMFPQTANYFKMPTDIEMVGISTVYGMKQSLKMCYASFLYKTDYL